MPKVWIAFDLGFGEWYMADKYPEYAASEVVEVDMNASLYRQIRAAQKKYAKFQLVLGKIFQQSQQSNTVRRVR